MRKKTLKTTGLFLFLTLAKVSMLYAAESPFQKLSETVLEQGWYIAVVGFSVAAYQKWFGNGKYVKEAIIAGVFFASIEWIVEILKGLF